MKYLICGNYGANNYGDELILSGIIRTLNKIDSKAEITVQSANPKQTTKQYQIKSVPHFPAGLRSFFKTSKQTKQALRETDFYILGGGGLFASLRFKANIIWGIQAFRAILNKKPLIIYGQSLENLKNPFTKIIVKNIFKRARFIAMRDQQSIDYLKSLGVHKTHLIPDPALNPQPRVKHQDFIALCLRGHCPMEHDQTFLSELRVKLPRNLRSILFHKTQDRAIHHLLAPDAPILKPEQLKYAKKAICMRLHAIITAINFGVPFYAISYSPKVENFLNTWNLQPALKNYLPEDTLTHFRTHLQKEIQSAEALLKTHLKV